MTRLTSAAAAVLLGLCASDLWAQQPRRITGRVTGRDGGEPVSGANILVQGTTLGTVANDSGVFSLAAPAGDVSLLIRRIGYQRETVPVPAAQAQVNVTLRKDVLRLETMVVTGAATSVARQNAANDIAVVSAEQLSRVPAPSIENALAGKAAGVQVIANSGAPGGGNQIRMRGVTSVFGSADPLYVVDGVIVSNDVIQSGANALSAARRASSNASNQDNGVNRIADLNPNDIESVEILKGASASAIYGSKASNGVVIIKTRAGTSGRVTTDLVQRIGTFQLSNKFGARRFSLDQAIAFGTAQGLTAEEVRQHYASCGGFCDYEQLLFGETPLAYETALSMRGGTDRTNFFASALNKYDGGIQKNTGYDKKSFRLNVTQLLGERVTVQLNNNLVRTVTRRGISNNDNANITPYFVLAATPSWFDMRPRDGVYPVNPFVRTNSFQNRDFIQTPEEVNRVISSGSVTWQAVSHERQTLQLRVDGGVDWFGQGNNIVSPRLLYFEPNDGLPGTVTSLSGRNLNANVNLALTHNWLPSSKAFSATSSFGAQREMAHRRVSNIVTRDVLLGQEHVNRGSATEVFEDEQEVRTLAMFGQEEFLALDERLLLTAGARAERSTANGDVNKFYFFPKASASYRLPWLPLSSDEFKLRVAIGQSGNQPLYRQKYSPALPTVYDGQNGLQAGPTRGNEQIKPERQTEIEGGLDATFYGSRAQLSLTGYQKTIDDVILQIASAPSQGYTVFIQNGGQFRNRGIEASIALTPIQRQDATWISRTMFARNVGVVTALPVPAFTVAQDATGQGVAFGAGYGIGRLEVGKRVTQIIGSDGPNGAIPKGDAAPKFTMGFANELHWKAVRFTSLFDWQKGGDLVNVTMNVYDAYGLAPDKADGGLERINLNDTQGFAQYISDASFVKLRELSVAYELPASLVRSALGGRAQTARLELSGRNLYTWTKYTGVDPEVSNFGSQQISRFIDLAPFPPSRSFFFTLGVSF